MAASVAVSNIRLDKLSPASAIGPRSIPGITLTAGGVNAAAARPGRPAQKARVRGLDHFDRHLGQPRTDLCNRQAEATRVVWSGPPASPDTGAPGPAARAKAAPPSWSQANEPSSVIARLRLTVDPAV